MGWSGCAGPVADALLDLDLPGLTVNVRDAPVRASLMTLTTLDPPVQAFVTLWVEQHYGDQVAAALDVLAAHAEHVAAYLVTESAPDAPAADTPGCNGHRRWPTSPCCAGRPTWTSRPG